MFMRIGNNYQGLMNNFSNYNNGKRNSLSASGNSKKSVGYHRNTLEDLLTGHFKNSYGVEGMCVTGRSDYKKIVSISDEMKQYLYDETKKAYYERNGMSGSDADMDAFWDKIHEYIKATDKDDRLSVTWTINQFGLSLSNKVVAGIKERDPEWEAGQPVSKDILDEIFADDKLFNDCVNAFKTMETSTVNTVDSQDTNASIEQFIDTESESESIGGSVVFNAEKRARQIASAKTAAEVRMVLGLLNKDLSDCKNGAANGMCDEAEVAKVEAMLRKAQQKMGQVGSNSEAESDGSFFINMLM